jgi:hypothetical protein
MRPKLPAYDGTLTIAMVVACPFPVPRGTPIRVPRPLAASFGRNARRLVQANHSWEHAVDRTEAMYPRLLA